MADDLSAEILEAHRVAVDAGDPTYVDPATGYLVFTAAFLLGRGWCCGNGCRHCPYPDGVPTGPPSTLETS